MLSFGKISEIHVDNPESWRGRCFLTFDIDWCEDFVLEYLLTRLEELDVPATFFVTHQTQLLDRIRRSKGFELGAHPNFNGLLDGNGTNGENAIEIIKRIMEVVPEATSVRSHSLVESSVLLNIFAEHGFERELNAYIPWRSGIELRPWRLWKNTLTRVPHFWEDDLHCCYGDSWEDWEVSLGNGLQVFNFHPIHLYLNTECLSRYENSRTDHRNFTALQKHRNIGGEGAESFLERLCRG